MWRLNHRLYHEVERIVHKDIDVKTLQLDDDSDYIVPMEEDADEEDDDYEEYEWDDDDDGDEGLSK